MGANQQQMLAQKIVTGGAAPTIPNVWKNAAGAGTVAVTVAPSAANMLFLVMATYATVHVPTDDTVSDNIGGSTGWTRIQTGKGTGDTNLNFSVWYKPNIPSSITTVTVTSTPTLFNFVSCIIHEVAGVSTSAPYTGGESNSTETGGATTTPTTTGVTNATANSVFFAVCVPELSSGNPATLTEGTTGGWSLANATNSVEKNASNFVAVSVASNIVSSSASRTESWTTSSVFSIMSTSIFHP